MDLATIAGLSVAIGGPLLGGVWWGAKKVYEAFNTLGDHGRRLGGLDEELADVRATQEQHDERLERTEDGVRNISKLADAINNMGEKVNGQIQHLAEVMGIHNRNNERQFEELRDRLGEERSFRKPDK